MTFFLKGIDCTDMSMTERTNLVLTYVPSFYRVRDEDNMFGVIQETLSRLINRETDKQACVVMTYHNRFFIASTEVLEFIRTGNTELLTLKAFEHMYWASKLLVDWKIASYTYTPNYVQMVGVTSDRLPLSILKHGDNKPEMVQFRDIMDSIRCTY